MCLLIEGNPLLMDGWGCCRCRTYDGPESECRNYNGLHSDCCWFCGEPHHPLTNENDDRLDARWEKEGDGEPS